MSKLILPQVALIDPPWPYGNQATRAATNNHYPAMTLQEIKDLAIPEMTAFPCALFLWITAPNLWMAFEVFDAWGFEYKTTALTWFKCSKTDPHKFVMGLGNYSRANPEPCLLAFKKARTRGRAIPVENKPKSWIIAPRREHSRKPDKQYSRINTMYPDLVKTEFFARQRYPGWQAWGEQADMFEVKSEFLRP